MSLKITMTSGEVYIVKMVSNSLESLYSDLQKIKFVHFINEDNNIILKVSCIRNILKI